jgi:membrane associated rhomboid family serine protease
MKMKLKYNSPVVLTFFLVCVAVLVLDQTLFHGLCEKAFAVMPRGGFSWKSPLCYWTLLSYVAGHAGWEHLVSNMMIILIIGPMLEEFYGSGELLFMMVITALAGGIMNALFFSTGLMGASGVVFMMILLASFTNFRKGEIPITFILVLLLYVGTEIVQAFGQDNISQFTHILGGLCGSVFGFAQNAARSPKPIATIAASAAIAKAKGD